MRKNIVLIDLENLQPESLSGLAQEHFQVKIFVGAKQPTIKTPLAVSIQRLGERAEYVQISGSGKDALDFHIAYYVGKFAEQDPTAYFHIVSKDKGFDPLIEHLKSRHISAAQSPSIEAIPAIKRAAATPAERAAATSPGECARAYVANLQKARSTQPSTTKALANDINHFFRKQLPAAETDAVIAVMQSERHITVKDEKITYAL